jgi:hypothetical protein
MIFNIPISFELYGIKYNVKFVDNLISEGDRTGETSYRFDEIRIQNILKGFETKPDRQEQIFFHELTHVILYAMQNKLRSDEVFVDVFASLLHQALTTMEFK